MLILRGQQSGMRLGIPLHYTLILPNEALNAESYPLIYCLHDLGQSGETLVHGLGIAPMADQLHAALLVPDGRRSCFVDMAHGPCWATALGTDVFNRLCMSFRIRRDCAGAVGIGTGALGAMQLTSRAAAARFVCAAVEPALDTPFAWDESRWPLRQEWMGVFDGKQDEYRAMIAAASGDLRVQGEGSTADKVRMALVRCAGLL